MQFLVHTGRADSADPKVLKDGLTAELAKVRELYSANIIRQIWHRADKPGAVLLLEAVSEEEATKAMTSLPLAVAGVVVIETVVELRPYAGFAS